MRKPCLVAACFLAATCACSTKTGGDWRALILERSHPPVSAPPGLEKIRVHRLGVSGNGGRWEASGVPLGNGEIATNRHVQVGTRLRIDGVWRDVTTVRVGADEGWGDDWRVITVRPEFAHRYPGTRHDFSEWAPEIGTQVVIKGYWGHREVSAEEPLPLVYVPARVARTPFHYLSWLWSGFGAATGTIPLEAPEKELYKGLSGGAVCVWDSETGEWIVRALYRGRLEWHLPNKPISEALGLIWGVHVAVQPK